MIGGTDITITTDAGASALDFCIRMIRFEWPDAVFQDADAARPFLSYEELAFGSLSEVFVYRDTLAADAWEEFGAESRNENTMIHLLSSPSTVTLVVDHPDRVEIRRIVAAIEDGLRGIFNMAAQVGAAA